MSPEAAEPEVSRRGGWRLAGTNSAYLRGAAGQSIEWHPWGPEPFELARRTRRPILLDIGAVWCHWCHVMDEGTYSDAEVARILQQNFVAVKVDRDENPEVDRRYQRQVGALTGEGGWPLTAFLTPDGAAFLGGTYFPVQDGMGRPGFRRLLREVARLYREEPQTVQQNTTAVHDALERMRRADRGSGSAPAAFVASVRASILSSFDPLHGGFGHAPKFPHPTAVEFLLYDGFATQDASVAERARTTLARMADGGIHDQVGGGFHRYAVDEGWHIPHFEKMGVDNAALLAAYVATARRFDDPGLAAVVRDTLDWSVSVLGQPGGGFGASQDADNAPGDDGGYFTWSRAELKALLDPAELRLVTRYFGVGSDGRMTHDPDRNVLFRLMPLDEASEGIDLTGTTAATLLDSALQKLRVARAARPTPVIDTALYASINGGFVRALAQAGRFLADPATLDGARAAADRFLAHAFDPDRGVAHRLEGTTGRGWGHLEDQAEFAFGLVELGGATADPRYVAAAAQILSVVHREFVGDGGLLRDLAPKIYDGPVVGGVDEPSYPLEDAPHLSANAAAALAMIRLAGLTQREEWIRHAQELVAAMQPKLAGVGLFGAGAALAAGLLGVPPARVVIEGQGKEAEALARAADTAWHPNGWVFRGVPPEPFSLPEEVSAATGDGAVRALVCFGTRCLAPVTDPGGLRPALESGGRSAPS
ncbi:MAG TPA: thioredoxin domain-containing protein [Thermoplasmata archaeon]|nr:thioredoxin domain-containing protein [Thermoplasmata archaeon]